MKANAHARHACQFELDEKRRKVRDLEAMISDFRQMIVNLDHQIVSEEERAGISDVEHFAYPTFAKAAIQRRDNLIVSVEDLEAKLEQARGEMDEATEELTKAEQLDRRENTKGKSGNDAHPTSNRF